MKIFSLSLAVITALDAGEMDSLATELENDPFDLSKYHDFQNTTFQPLDYAQVVKEYFDGGSQLLGVGPRGRSRTTSGPVGSRSAAEDKEFIQRFLQLKYSILFLQRNKKFGRYCFYGCWCLPTGSADLGVGTGPPIDDIDRSCREFATCYNCLYNTEIGSGCDVENPGRYTIKGRMDPVTKQKYLMCMDPPGTCKRMRCECDRSLAEKLQEYEGQWNIQNHRRWGSPVFDAAKYCTVPTQTATPDDVYFEANYSPAGFEPQPIYSKSAQDDTGLAERKTSVPSTGNIIQPQVNFQSQSVQSNDQSQMGQSFSRPAAQSRPTFPAVPIYGEIQGCCGRSPNLHYFRVGQRCCADGEVVDQNAPCGIDFL